MLERLRNWYLSFHASFHGSEVILWARCQYIFFLVYTGLQVVDVSLFISDKHLLQGYMFMNAIVTEAKGGDFAAAAQKSGATLGEAARFSRAKPAAARVRQRNWRTPHQSPGWSTSSSITAVT